MSVDLSGAGGHFRWTTSAWIGVMYLGQNHGWNPLGTGPPKRLRGKAWNGSYGFNDGAIVYARDAKAFADALERAISELPAVRPPDLGFIEDYDWFVSQRGQHYLQQFMAFCRAGSFRIF